MRSLWRIMASRWLGGDASAVLTEDAALVDLLTRDYGEVSPAFLVRRQSQVSHGAMMSQQRATPPQAAAPRQFIRTDRDA